MTHQRTCVTQQTPVFQVLPEM